MAFLPISKEDMNERGWDQLDFLYISGDAYVDHPSFGHAIITRVLEKEGFKVGIIAQPDWNNINDFMRLGRPKYAVLISSGVIDSMVNHYTASKKIRREDGYSPGGNSGNRPDRAVIVYSNRIREAFKDLPIIIGGIEASLRRFAHYDYWDNKVRRSILSDSKADLLIYGMGEKPIVEIAQLLKQGESIHKIQNIRGTAYIASLDALPEKLKEFIDRSHEGDEGNVNSTEKNTFTWEGWDWQLKAELIPSYEEVCSDKTLYTKAFRVQYNEQDAISGKTLIQRHGNRYLVQNPPSLPLMENEMDKIYALPYEKTYHPSYEKQGGIPAIQEVAFSITSHRGCFGGCSFCALHFHQGRVIQRRSQASIIQEAKNITWLPDFKGYIHDVGGPTANFRSKACDKQLQHGVCKGKQCLYPTPCKNLKVDHSEYLELLKKIRTLPEIKRVFIRSGIRYDYLMLDENDAFFTELCEHHVSGQLKVAPEHIVDRVLEKMGKPGKNVYNSFVKKFYDINKRLGKEQYLVPYLISGHPGSDLKAAVELALYLKEMGYMPEQVQDFYPTPGTLSTCMYYTEIDPRTMKPVYVPKDIKEKAMQRALLQYGKRENYNIVYEALVEAGREDLIGNDKKCLIRPRSSGVAIKRADNRKELNKSNTNTKSNVRGASNSNFRGETISNTTNEPKSKFKSETKSNLKSEPKSNLKSEPKSTTRGNFISKENNSFNNKKSTNKKTLSKKHK